MKLLKALLRRKRYDDTDSNASKLARMLKLFDLRDLGVGSTLGVGVYVLAGDVALYEAGPGVIISFAFAGIVWAFAALCYAEFAARVPKGIDEYI